MSYHIYTTKGLILKERGLKEADKSVKILTRDIGLVNATAIGARKGSSKRSPALTELSMGKFSLIRAKKDWRITNAELDINVYSELKTNKKLLHSIIQPIYLLEKLVQGEEKNKNLFDILETVIFFGINNKLEAEQIKNLEIYTAAMILGELGYLNKDNSINQFVQKPLSNELLNNLSGNKKVLISSINRGIRASGLV